MMRSLYQIDDSLASDAAIDITRQANHQLQPLLVREIGTPLQACKTLTCKVFS